MAIDTFAARGSTSANKPDAGGAVTHSVPVLGTVKDNIDPTRAGRIRVYIADLGGEDPDNADNWTTVGYMSPFFGQTDATAASTGYGDATKNPVSYGVWNSPPDIGSVVVCIFINGDVNYGYYIGCVPSADTLYMVPAIGASEKIIANTDGEANGYGGATRLPVTNYNINDDSKSDSANFLDTPRPIYSYAASIYFQQGLLRDTIRGPISTSSQRETPSRVGWGVNTPGRPIYEGGLTDDNIAEAAAKNDQDSNLKIISRRPGHSFVMDDGDLIGRDQLIRLRSSLGHQILMSDNGQCLTIIHANGQSYVELGKEGTVDVYSTNSVNVRTQGDLNLHADNNINISALKSLNISAESMTVNTDKTIGMRAGTDYKVFTQNNYTVKVNGKMSQMADGESSFASGSTTYINGEKINLNTGSTSLIPEEVPIIPIVAHTDTLNDNEKGWAAAPGKLLSIVTRAPAHMPWAAANQGVDVKVSGAAADALPSNPSTQLADTNKSVANVSVPSVSSPVISTVPSTSAVSAAIDKNTTAALVGQQAVLAATGITKDAVQNGMGVISTSINGVSSNIASLGQLAQTPSQLEAAGVLKPGSSNLINALVDKGQSIEKAMTLNLFTGKIGAESLDTFVNNTQAQVDTAVSNFSQAQNSLQNAGLITGKESGTQLGGLVMSAATQGVGATVDYMKQSAGGISGNIGGVASNTLLGSAQKMIAAGQNSTNIAATVTGGLSSITNAIGKKGISSLPGLGDLAASAKGVAGAAFAAVTAGLPKLAKGVPQDIKKITSDAQKALGNFSQGPAGVASLASGLNSIPGAANAVSSITNRASGAINSVPGLTSGGAISSLINNPAGDLLNKLKTGQATLPSVASLGLPQGSIAQLNSAITSLSSGGAIPIQLPKVGTGTFNRDVIGGQIANTIGNPKVPLPNFSGNPSTFGETAATQKLDNRVAKIKELDAIYDKIQAEIPELRRLKTAYINAYNELPDGDPGVEAAKQAYKEQVTKVENLQKQYNELFKNIE